MNLKPNLLTYVVWIFYSIGILCSYCLMVSPTFKILKTIPLYNKIPDFSIGRIRHLKTLITRALVVLFCCSLAYKVPNLGQFLNFQGSVTGILMTFILPIACYFKAFSGRISPREMKLCYALLAFGIIGGTVSAYYAFLALINPPDS